MANGQIMCWGTYKHLQPLGVICILTCRGLGWGLGKVVSNFPEEKVQIMSLETRNSQCDPNEIKLQLYYYGLENGRNWRIGVQYRSSSSTNHINWNESYSHNKLYEARGKSDLVHIQSFSCCSDIREYCIFRHRGATYGLSIVA